jgi:hypothetical protein
MILVRKRTNLGQKYEPGSKPGGLLRLRIKTYYRAVYIVFFLSASYLSLEMAPYESGRKVFISQIESERKIEAVICFPNNWLILYGQKKK